MKRPRPETSTHISSPATFQFNDPSTSDVTLHLYLESSPSNSLESNNNNNNNNNLYLNLHSHILRESQYFSALLSDRWKNKNTKNLVLEIPASTGTIQNHLTLLQLLYTKNFSEIINSVTSALSLLPVALELLFEDCIKACVKFLEAVPWNEEEEMRVVNIIPFLKQEECKQLVSRIAPENINCCEEMLDGMITSAIQNCHNMTNVKIFVSKMLREFKDKAVVRNVLDRAFSVSLSNVKCSLEDYSSPEFRGDLGETEAIQRLNLHSANTNVRHLLWLIEMMIELRVADRAVEEWSEQYSLAADLQRAFREDACIIIVPALPITVLRCLLRLATAVTTGSFLAPKEVRMNLVNNWLPVLIICKHKVSPGNPIHKSLYQEIEETFLGIISTLPMLDAQELLQQCLSFSTRSVEDCPHLVAAFNTWFRRAARPPQIIE